MLILNKKVKQAPNEDAPPAKQFELTQRELEAIETIRKIGNLGFALQKMNMTRQEYDKYISDKGKAPAVAKPPEKKVSAYKATKKKTLRERIRFLTAGSLDTELDLQTLSDMALALKEKLHE